ncbi:MAG: biotin--[acetyl-CoA-carboxylase] ligase [Dehalococcoidia bacterium]
MRVDRTAALERLVAMLKAAAPEAVSGVLLSDRMGVSRTAVWKQIATLRRLGYRIESAPRLGYRLTGSPDRFYPWEVRDGLHSLRFGQAVHYFDATGSTQDEARRLAETGAPEGALVIAEQQRAPRGRLGRSYFTPPGGLWFSLLLRPRRTPEEVIALSLLAAVGVHRAIEAVTGLRATVKWPNDLLLDGRKAVGILVELLSEQDVLRYAVVGVGVNANLRADDFPAELRATATSLRETMGREVSRLSLLRRTLEHMETLYDDYLAQGPGPILAAWRSLPSVLGQQVQVDDLRQTWEGVAIDLDEDGALLVRTAEGSVRRVLAGDVRPLIRKAS